MHSWRSIGRADEVIKWAELDDDGEDKPHNNRAGKKEDEEIMSPRKTSKKARRRIAYIDLNNQQPR